MLNGFAFTDWMEVSEENGIILLLILQGTLL